MCWEAEDNEMKRILILGGGFGGLVVAEQLSKQLGREHQITLVSTQRTFTFYPALVRLAFGELEPEEVTFDLERKLHKLDVRFIEGEVLHLKPEIHRVQIAGKEFNGDLSYDYLVIALGRRLATEKLHGFFDYAHHILSIPAATKFGKAIDDFTHGNVIVGLTPNAKLPTPVCETAFALANCLDDTPTNPVNISVVFPGKVKDAFGGADLHTDIENAFTKHGIELIEDFPVNNVMRNRISSRNGDELPFDLLMLVPPFSGQGRLSENGITDKDGFVEVDEYMRVKGMKNAYAAGDIVSFDGPKLAHIAVGQAQVVAVNIASEIRGEEPDTAYYHEIAIIIDQGGAESIYLHYGMWDESMYRFKQGTIWGLVKRVHDRIWRMRHKTA
jgi:sulfide:quinone oxidoreductase